jgi:hypothetical protein
VTSPKSSCNICSLSLSLTHTHAHHRLQYNIIIIRLLFLPVLSLIVCHSWLNALNCLTLLIDLDKNCTSLQWTRERGQICLLFSTPPSCGMISMLFACCKKHCVINHHLFLIVE